MAFTKAQSALHNALQLRGGQMVSGIQMHNEDALPPRLDADKLVGELKALREKRQAFVEAQRVASERSQAYQRAFELLERELAKADDTVRGHYGKSDPTVLQFGTALIGGPRRKSKKAAKSAPKE